MKMGQINPPMHAVHLNYSMVRTFRFLSYNGFKLRLERKYYSDDYSITDQAFQSTRRLCDNSF